LPRSPRSAGASSGCRSGSPTWSGACVRSLCQRARHHGHLLPKLEAY
jgi:hypothetical protein